MSLQTAAHVVVSVHCGVAAWLIVENLWTAYSVSHNGPRAPDGSPPGHHALELGNSSWMLASLKMNAALLSMWICLTAAHSSDCMQGWLSACRPSTWCSRTPLPRPVQVGGSQGEGRGGQAGQAAGRGQPGAAQGRPTRRPMYPLLLLAIQIAFFNCALTCIRFIHRHMDGLGPGPGPGPVAGAAALARVGMGQRTGEGARQAGDIEAGSGLTGHTALVWHELYSLPACAVSVTEALSMPTPSKCSAGGSSGQGKGQGTCKGTGAAGGKQAKNKGETRSHFFSSPPPTPPIAPLSFPPSFLTRASILWHCSPRMTLAKGRVRDLVDGLQPPLQGMKTVIAHAARGRDVLDVFALLFLGPFALAIALVSLAILLASLHCAVLWMHLLLPPQAYAAGLLLFMTTIAWIKAEQYRAARTAALVRPGRGVRYPALWPSFPCLSLLTWPCGRVCRRAKGCSDTGEEAGAAGQQGILVRIRPYVPGKHSHRHRSPDSERERHRSRQARLRGRDRQGQGQGAGEGIDQPGLCAAPSAQWENVLATVAQSDRLTDVCCVCLEAFHRVTPRASVGSGTGHAEVVGAGLGLTNTKQRKPAPTGTISLVFTDPICVCDCSHTFHVACIDRWNASRMSSSAPTFPAFTNVPATFAPMPGHHPPLSPSLSALVGLYGSDALLHMPSAAQFNRAPPRVGPPAPPPTPALARPAAAVGVQRMVRVQVQALDAQEAGQSTAEQPDHAAAAQDTTEDATSIISGGSSAGTRSDEDEEGAETGDDDDAPSSGGQQEDESDFSDEDIQRLNVATALSPLPMAAAMIILGGAWPWRWRMPCCARRTGRGRAGGARRRGNSGMRAEILCTVLGYLRHIALLPWYITSYVVFTAFDLMMCMANLPPLEAGPGPRVGGEGGGAGTQQNGAGQGDRNRRRTVLEPPSLLSVVWSWMQKSLGCSRASRAGLGEPTKCPACRAECATLRVSELHVKVKDKGGKREGRSQGQEGEVRQ